MNGTNEPNAVEPNRGATPADDLLSGSPDLPAADGLSPEGGPAAPEFGTTGAPIGAASDDERVITIGWRAVALPAVAILVALAGFALGAQALKSRGTAQSAAAVPASTLPAAGGPTNPRIRTFEMGEITGGSATVNIAPPGVNAGQAPPPVIGADDTGAPEGQVIDLPARDHPLLGKVAPDFTMTRVGTGEEVSLSDFQGQPVLVNFWATWCPPCRLEMPWLQSAYDAHLAEGFVVLAVDAGEKVPPSMVEDTVQRFLDSAGLTFPVLAGDNTYAVQREWSVLGLPASFILDGEGKVVDFMSGAYPNQATLEHRLEAVLSPDEQ